MPWPLFWTITWQVVLFAIITAAPVSLWVLAVGQQLPTRRGPKGEQGPVGLTAPIYPPQTWTSN